MKRTPLKRTPFKRKHEPPVKREPHPMFAPADGDMALIAPAAPRIQSLRKGSYGPAKITAAPKSEAKRNPALLEMAQGRRCLLRVPDVCTGDTATTVAAHSNFAEHGKSGARKADDCYSVWGCAACHRWLDAGTAPREVKRARFTLAHLDQVVEWRHVALDMGEPARFRRAAQWALDALKATTTGETA